MSTESSQLGSTLPSQTASTRSVIGRVLGFCIDQKLIVFLLVILMIGAGLVVAPFDWHTSVPRYPINVDAIPDTGENQQIVFTEWAGRSPQDVEDQLTYPLTVALLGVPEVKDIRSYSYFGFSTIHVIFNDSADYYWTRSRILEKLNALASDALPAGVKPALGPDATALGQVFWYTLEGRDSDNQPIGGWDLDELRSTQDWYVRYGLAAAEGVAEVASIGGFVREYQVDVDPDAMRSANVTLQQVLEAVRQSNVDVGARTIELNRVEYVVRGRGLIGDIEDLNRAVVAVNDNTPITVRDVAAVHLGPALRRGVLDKGGAEAVGGVVVARYSQNPLRVIQNVKDQIETLGPGMPRRPVIDWTRTTSDAVRTFAEVNNFEPFTGPAPSLEFDRDAWLSWMDTHPRGDWPEWLNYSRVTIVPFYDRTTLIHETLGTLSDALTQQVLITVIVVLVMVMHLRSAIMISAMLPLAVLATFIFMKLAGVEANVVALAGIAIAIGTVVDVGIVMTENILRRLDEAGPDEAVGAVIHRAAAEVGPAVLTAVATTVVSFLPVFSMIGAEGKLFRPLAFTKTFALIGSIIVALAVIPPLAHLMLRRWPMLFSLPRRVKRVIVVGVSIFTAFVVTLYLTADWMPIGLGVSYSKNLGFVLIIVAGLLLAFRCFQSVYGAILRWCLDHKLAFCVIPVFFAVIGATAWLGFDRVFAVAPRTFAALNGDPATLTDSALWRNASQRFPGLGREFMPALDEGSFLLMPFLMPHASISEATETLATLDRSVAAIPEVETVVGKIGRVDSALDPGYISMVEAVISYKTEFITDEAGRPIRYRIGADGSFIYDAAGQLIPDDRGRPFRQWREHILSPQDIWNLIAQAAQLPGLTGAPKLQPIETRSLMLQTGMRAEMGIKVKASASADLGAIEQFGLRLEQILRSGGIAGIDPATVNAERIVAKPYLEIDIDRDAIQRHGLSIRDVQDVIEVAVGGRTLTQTIEGRQRYGVRVRYMRELRDTIESLDQVVVPSLAGAQIPLAEIAQVRYTPGPMMIKSENTFLTSYVTFGRLPGYADTDVVEAARTYLKNAEDAGELRTPPGIGYHFAGSYENQARADRTLLVVMPVCLVIIFLILYLQFRSAVTAFIIFSGVLVAWSGGFLLLWLYGQPGFLDFEIGGENLRRLFNIHTINLSVAVWVGFIALFGIATDDGVVIATYIKQRLAEDRVDSVASVRRAVLEAGLRRVRPCLMTTATTLLALLPVLTATGRGSDLMLPMAVPIFGGMALELLTMFVVPVLCCAVEERRAGPKQKAERAIYHSSRGPVQSVVSLE